MDPALYVGRAPWQVHEYLENEVQPLLDARPVGDIAAHIEI